jgi:hypothetical protein
MMPLANKILSMKECLLQLSRPLGFSVALPVVQESLKLKMYSFITQHRRQYRMVSDPVSALYYHNVNIFAFTQDCNDGKDFVEKLGGNGFSPNPWRSPIKKPVPKCRSARTSRVEKTTNR